METGLQEARLAELHTRALRLRDAWSAAWSGLVPVPGDAPTRAHAALARLAASTQLMEAISWLLVRHAGDATPTRRHAGAHAPRGLTGERATVAAAIDRLYGEILALDAGHEA
ncbi:hypothetical protein [Glacieibacterium frigidum]|uniref:Uncharacterized protein n=1 Tax=Glacieibacterium frigidum TaxID=2593303 RepID=A0A552UA62_9SPHN|nr:hypothetical protein [Glacieibacterium frigidum]TRW15106.1 hypothetical protein FMM06_15790 [Glacieibacterium frigidum]